MVGNPLLFMPDTPTQRYSVMLDRLVGSNQWDRAAQTARDWLSEDPLSLPAHRALAQALINLEQHAAAGPHIDRVLAGNPRDGFAHRLASIACFARKDFAGADDHIQQAIALQPQLAMHWYHLAWMRYQHGAHEAAARYGARALALAPENADIINLLALCQRTDATVRLAQYERALALDPENSMVHNNVGAYYLHAKNDPRRALESFRQALRIDPTNATAQKNLFAALRSTDPIYKVLSFPRRVLEAISVNRSGGLSGRNLFRLLFFLTVGHVAFGAFLVIYGLCLVVGLPLLKGYEYLTMRDLRARAGVPGARTGGLWGFWRWPFAVRFGLYGLFVAAFWTGVVWLGRDIPWIDAAMALAALALAVLCGRAGVVLWKTGHRRFRNWRAERRFQRRMDAVPPPPLPRS